MGDAGEGLIDADARIQERMEELERERTRQQHGKPVRDPEKMHALESLRLARTELDRQLAATTNERRRDADRAGASQRSTAAWRPLEAASRAEAALCAVHAYHDGTKHHFQRFARSLGYLDWASQPNPFRSFAGAPAYALSPAARRGRPPCTRRRRSTSVMSCACSLGLSAWKQFRESSWSLRVNPSSGNLHPTEAYVVCRPDGRRRRDACRLSLRGRSSRARAAVRVDACGLGRRHGAATSRLAGRADVDSLARGMEVRRAGVPLLPARSRTCDRGRPDRRGARWLARAPAPGLVPC